MFDSAGNLYGTTQGTVYESSPTQSGWLAGRRSSIPSRVKMAVEQAVSSWPRTAISSGLPAVLMEALPPSTKLTPQDGSWSFSLLQNFGSDYPAARCTADL